MATVASTLFLWMTLTASSPHSAASCSSSGIYSRYWSRKIWLKRKSSTWDLAADDRIGLVSLNVCVCVCVVMHAARLSHRGDHKATHCSLCAHYTLYCHLHSIKELNTGFVAFKDVHQLQRRPLQTTNSSALALASAHLTGVTRSIVAGGLRYWTQACWGFLFRLLEDD